MTAKVRIALQTLRAFDVFMLTLLRIKYAGSSDISKQASQDLQSCLDKLHLQCVFDATTLREEKQANWARDVLRHFTFDTVSS